jgi:hypothetical protein
MASEVGICNLALQRVGAKRIASLTEDSKNARECNTAYESVRDKELRKFVWKFAKKRAALAPNATAPDFDYSYKFELPSDFIRLVSAKAADGDTDEIDDYVIEGKYLLTSDTDTLYLVYVSRVTDPNKFDTLFIETLYHALALQVGEAITQSNSKMDRIKEDYKDALAEAKRTGSIEEPSKKAPADSWVLVRA